jgi:hypothetical protein
MKVPQLMRLGFKNISAHKKLYAVVIVIVGLLIGTLVTTIIILSRNEKSALSAELAKTSGRVIISNSICETSYQNLEEPCKTPEVYDEIVREKSKKYNGNMAGAVITYTNENGALSVISDKVAKNLDGYTPMKNEINGYMVFNNTERVQNYLAENHYSAIFYHPVVIFDSLDDAYNYYFDMDFEVSELFSKNIETKKFYNEKKSGFLKMTIAIFIITLMILGSAMFIVIRTDSETIRLYRSAGATKIDVFRIYFATLFELLIIAIILSLSIGILAAGILIK